MKVEIHSKTRVFDGFFKIDEVELRFQRFDGSMTPTVRRLNFDRGDSVAAVVHNIDSRKVLLTKQFKYPTYEKGPGWVVEVVAGMVESGETPMEAIAREIFEEVGYAPSHVAPISTFYVSPGGSSERIILFYAEVNEAGRKGEGGGLPTEDEDIELVSLSPKEMLSLLSSNQVVDAKTIIALTWLRDKWFRGDGGTVADLS